MAEPTTWSEVFDRIQQEGKDCGVAYTTFLKYLDWTREAFVRAKENYPLLLRDKTHPDFSRYSLQKLNLQRQAKQMLPPPTAQQFWNAAYAFGRPIDGQAGYNNELYSLLTSGRIGTIPLGKLSGQRKLRLVPALGALPVTEQPRDITTFNYAETHSGAVMYPGGHPSEETLNKWISSAADDKLRRFASLGWVIQEDGSGPYTKTGHVLVMDMATDRDRHPWFILAFNWPSEDEQFDGSFIVHAPERVFHNDKYTDGVFPGDSNRTTIGKISPFGKSENGTGPLLKRFSEDFEFTLLRDDAPRQGEDVEWGPDLVYVMDWYWDPDMEEEVCYKDGSEYLRYKPETDKYKYLMMH